MNVLSSFEALTGPAKAGILGLAYLNPEMEFNLSGIAKKAGLAKNAVFQQVPKLVEGGLLLERRLANLRLFRANPDSPLYSLLVEIARESEQNTVERVCVESFSGLDGVEEIVLFGSEAAGTAKEGSDVDILLFSELTEPKSFSGLAKAAGHAASALGGRSVNPIWMSYNEWKLLAETGNAFYQSVTSNPTSRLYKRHENETCH